MFYKISHLIVWIGCKWLFVIAVLNEKITNSPVRNGLSCPDGWLGYEKHCYLFYYINQASQAQNWSNALLSCQRYGGNLLSIEDQAENTFIKNQLKSRYRSYWIGLNDIKIEGTFVWSDGSSPKISNWKANEPNSLGDEDCVEINSDGWNDLPCQTLLNGFICKISRDPCLGYREINDFQRSTAFTVDPNKPFVCNNAFIADWYRFTSGAGGKIPTTNPPPYSCGAKNPTWLNVTEPTALNETISGQACVVVDNNICAHKVDVKVKKCFQNNNEFFVYYLLPLPQCSMRYCAGTKRKCDMDENSPTGFSPCSSYFPKIEKDPVVTVGVDNKRIRFTCKFHTVQESNARYEVTWFQGPEEKHIKGPEVFTSNKNEAFLQNTNKYGENTTFCLGYNIYCKVSSYYIGHESNKSRERKSNEFFAGFQVTPKTLELSENGKPQKVFVTSTVPIVCEDGTENCNVLLELGQTKTDSFVDYCSLMFKPGPAGQKQEIEVVAKRDFVDDGNQKMFLQLFVPDHVDPVDWNCHKQITDVEIKTVDVKTARCTSTGDPHITTFDQFYYNHYYVGDYVLMHSTARNFRVHVRTFACGSVSCNCGVAAQEGDDVIVIDMCRDSAPRARFASTVEPQPGTSITRNNNGKSFILSFSSGAYVKFNAFHWYGKFYYANIEVQVPSDDFNSTQGLCGTFDKNKNNDMTAKSGQIYAIKQGQIANHMFTESWKLNVSAENLFYFKGGPRKCTATRAKSYCTCSESCSGAKRKINCDYEGYSDRPKYIHGVIGWKKLEFPGAEHCARRKRRSMDDNVIILPDDGTMGVYDYNPNQVFGNVTSFPTKSGITEEKARDECRKKIRNSIAGKACIDVIGPLFKTDDYEQQCVIDIQVTDNEKVGVESAINNLISACEELTLRNLSFWESGNGNITGPPVIIAQSVCPNECNGNGACKNGTCICNSGFITSDCSLKEGQSPLLFSIPNSGLCDIRDQDCIRTRVTGMDFVDSNSLSCKMTEMKISEHPPEKIGKVFINKGQLLSFAEISCHLPKVPVSIKYSSIQPGKFAGGYAISVSNDNQNFSDNEVFFLVYDSKCMECNTKDIICKWKNNSCKINDYCFAENDPNPKQWCEVCYPIMSRTSFSKRTNNIPPSIDKFTSKQYTFKGQEWSFKIPAFDPENQPLVYSFIGESYGMKVSSSGNLTWTPDKIGKYYFTIKVTDPCGLSDFANFEVEIMQCLCEGKNDGYCIWQGEPGNNTFSVCQCPHGCTGELCTQTIDGLVCKIRIKTDQHRKWGDISETILAVIIAVLVFLFVILVATTYVLVSLKKRNKKLNVHNFVNFFSLSNKIDSNKCKGTFNNESGGKATVDFDESYINKGFVKKEVNTIEKKILST
ncbi:von Willebrand factor D and EGF domain-containing protein isoform X3 [Hydra vulgaris]|uniref:von Willebrand factor D and EGF domain-containing protein isoform X3 n=1 Tax=Hydra vulgaris TaxID=6087 RepID=A0ABM4BRX9_HYDVU